MTSSASSTPCAVGAAVGVQYTATAVSSAGNNRLASALVSYDGAGNVTQDANNRYVYDPEGRTTPQTWTCLWGPRKSTIAVESLVGGSGATEYLYDAEGRRVAKGTLGGAGLAAAFPAVGSGVVTGCPGE